MYPDSMFDPRKVGDTIARLEKTADGGGKVVSWERGAWVDCDFVSVGDIMVAPIAPAATLARLGIPWA